MNDYRQNAFREKFSSAAGILGVAPTEVVSLKVRENVGSYSEYHQLIRSLEREFDFKCSSVDDGLQGRGHLLTGKQTKVIVVEHETGLEILYIAGSIASLVAVIPLILKSWRDVRGFINPKNPFNSIEIRRIDANGNLYESPNDPSKDHGIADPFSINATVAHLIHLELQSLATRTEALLPRVAALEQRLANVENALKTKGSKKRTKRK